MENIIIDNPNGPKKRGRKKKIPTEPVEPVVNVPKKRGRKPKGGKLISKPIENNDNNTQMSNIILHLKCSLEDINSHHERIIDIPYQPIVPPEIKTYDTHHNFSNYNDNDDYCSYAYSNTIVNNNTNLDTNDSDNINIKDVNSKLKELKIQLYKDNIPDKKSACFWCTYEYDNPTCYIPLYEINNNICGYGSFCRPECAVAFLLAENIDDSSKFERYQLLNRIYGKVYNYHKNIKPAPNPHYLLDKFYGNLNIQEFRKLLKSEHLLLIIDKPITRILPELHDDNDNNPGYISNNAGYKVKRQSEQTKGPSKNDLMREKFGF